MDSFIYSINATMPIFLVMVLGWFLYRKKLVNDQFVQQGNKLVFNVALPVQLFNSVASTDFSVFADVKLLSYCILTAFGAFPANLLTNTIPRVTMYITKGGILWMFS